MGVVAGTAGHIDHGKSSLVRWLTGKDPDRLKEEKLRGITIELGYVFMPLPEGGVLAFIDVPGHEKFVRQMVAGVATIDFFLLVVAADEGVMPQTREHFDILKLLGVETGLVALTKCDMVDSDIQDLAEAEVSELFSGTRHAGTQVLRVSSVTGEGMEQLRSALASRAKSIGQRDSGGRFRLAIDRVFTLQGHGTVVAGTVLSGSVQPGDSLELLPAGQTYRVREIRVNEGRTPGAGTAGDRVALNLVGLEKEEAWRGSTLASPGWLKPVAGIDAECSMLSDARLVPRQRVRFHTGTAEIMAWAVPMAEGGLAPGSTGFVHFQLEEDVVAMPGDRFVIRRYSPVTTIGGGVILEAGTDRMRVRARDERLKRAEMLSGGDIGGILAKKLESAAEAGFGILEAARELGREEGEIASSVAGLVQSGMAVVFRDGSSERVVSSASASRAACRLLETLQAYHSERPLSAGLLSSQVARLFPSAPQWFLKGILLSLAEQGRIRRAGERIALASHPEMLPDPLPPPAAALVSSIVDAGIGGLETGPDLNSALMDSLLERGLALELEKGLFTTPSVAGKAAAILGQSFGKAEFRLGELRQALGVPRKKAVLWAELLDRLGVTGRKGDLRYLAGAE
jgi:selenocysteine-specific elongation factor